MAPARMVGGVAVLNCVLHEVGGLRFGVMGVRSGGGGGGGGGVRVCECGCGHLAVGLSCGSGWKCK